MSCGRVIDKTISGSSRTEQAYARLESTLWSHWPQTEPDGITDAVELARQARALEYISAESVRAVEGLTAMRNLAAYRPASEVTPARAAEYVAIPDATLYGLRPRDD